MKINIAQFQRTVWDYYRAHGRDLPWRKSANPYHIVVSEVMLQQTQVSRVCKKYPEFLRAFPTFGALAKAPISKILRVWQGMGYNRRAIALSRIAQKVVQEFNGKLPEDPAVLATFPGIGSATAGSIAAFAFNFPAVFIETNIRRAFIDWFFEHKKNVHDDEILPYVKAALDRHNIRKWYWALMDYGAMLASCQKNPNRKSAHYRVQPPFHNSNRQLRGMILRLLLKSSGISLRACVKKTRRPASRVRTALAQLEQEGFAKTRGGKSFLIS